MKTAWKWILGIIIVLVIVAAVVAVPFVMRNYMAARLPATAANALPQGQGPNGNGWNMMPKNGGRQGLGQGQSGFDGRGGPMMGGGQAFNRGFNGGRFSPFGFGFMFLGGLMRLIPLILLGLLIWGVYQLGRRSGLRSNQVPVTVSAAPVQPEVSATETNQDPTI